MLEHAAAIFVEKRVEDGVLTAEVTVRNVGCGHALPTGEPMRSLLLLVNASCGARALAPAGGDVVPDFGGYIARKTRGEDWTAWAGARPGDLIRVASLPGGHHDYRGFGPFGDGTFSAAGKGLPIERYAGTSSVVRVGPGDRVELDAPLAAGDVAYLVRGADAFAGAPGFGFARVLVAADGRRMVPHFLAVDVASDNRLLPLARWTSTHVFAADCPDPTVTATLVHRPFPFDLARERGWAIGDQTMIEVRR